MNFVREPKGIQKLEDDFELSGENVIWRQKTVDETREAYKNPSKGKNDNRVAYRVANQNFNRDSYVLGNLQWGITYINPITVDGECAMTRGHYHDNYVADEYYFCLGGKGFLLFWDGSEDFYVEKMFPGSLHYINGKYAHRIINIGEEVLAVAACSLPDSRQNHKAIQENGFPYRCYKENGEIVWKKEEK